MSSSSPPFTLFNLPYVPLSIILNTMNEMQIMKVALTSKKVYKLSKTLRKSGTEQLHVGIGKYTSIRNDASIHGLFRVLELSEIQEDSRIEYLKIGDTVVKTQKAKDEKEYIHLYHEDHFIGIQTISEIVSDFFNVPIYSLFVSGDKNINDPRRAIDWIMSRQETIAKCSFDCEETSEEDLTYFLDRLRVTKDLNMFVKTSENFQYSFKHPMNLDSMYIVHRTYPWLTINNLLEVNPRYLEVLTTKFTNEDMNLFIRNWINGGNSNLQSLIFQMNQIDLDIILNDIPALWTQTADDISYDLGDRVDQPDHFNSFIEIRNVNGVVASIVIELGETNYFFIYVWPDFKGNPYPLEPIVQ